jgi:ketosteroid isomerase-like protein
VSSANVDVVRGLFAAWTSGDWSSTAWADPQVDFVMEVDAFPDMGAYHGVEEMRHAWSGFLSAWEEFRASEPELIDRGDRVIGLYTIRARGRSSGVEVKQPVAGIFTLRDGKVVRIELVTREQGLRSAGINA